MTTDTISAADWWKGVEVRVTYINTEHEQQLANVDLTEKKARAKRELFRIFQSMPEEHRTFIQERVTVLHLDGLMNIGGEATGGVYNLVTGGPSEPFTVSLCHDYKYIPSGIHNDRRYINFTRVIPDTREEVSSQRNNDGMRLEENFSLDIVDAANSILVNEVSVQLGEIVSNANNSRISVSISENNEVVVFLSGYDFQTTVQDVKTRFPEIGELAEPETKWYDGKDRSYSNWKFSIPLEQAVAFRDAVREQIMIASRNIPV